MLLHCRWFLEYFMSTFLFSLVLSDLYIFYWYGEMGVCVVLGFFEVIVRFLFVLWSWGSLQKITYSSLTLPLVLFPQCLWVKITLLGPIAIQRVGSVPLTSKLLHVCVHGNYPFVDQKIEKIAWRLIPSSFHVHSIVIMMFNFVSTWLWHKALRIISECVCKGVSGETSIWVAELSEADYPPQHGEPSFNLLRVWIEQKRRGRRNSLSARLLTYDFNLLLTKTYTIVPPALRNIPLIFLSLQLAGHKSWNFSASTNVWVKSL